MNLPNRAGSFPRPGGLVHGMGERGRVGVTSPHIAMFGSIITNVSSSRDNIVSFKSRYIHVVFITRLGWAAVGETQCIRAVNL
jgi:hypothetical protein